MNKLEKLDDGGFIHWCEGCSMPHEIPGRGNWQFNGDMDKPTFSPSVRHSWTWGEERTPKCCHYFIRDGLIDYCTDSTHALAGQTIELKDVDEAERAT